MNRSSFLLVIAVSMLLGLSSCSGPAPSSSSSSESSSPHTEHVYGPWTREEDEHVRRCTICGKAEYGPHDHFVCEVCADYSVLAIGFVEGGDGAHADFANEANEFFKAKGEELGFYYEHTTDFGALNEDNLARFDAVLFLNDHPWGEAQKTAFMNYMEDGGGWIGFHSCAFTTNSTEWSWYHEEFLACGNFRSNTWNPTPETLHVDSPNHPVVEGLPETWETSPNEWYSWMNDLRENDDIDILLSLDESTYPVGDRVGEIWYNESGDDYVPVAWSNRNYKMVYMNMGHNLMSYNDFEKKSKTFSSEKECEFVLNALKYVAS